MRNTRLRFSSSFISLFRACIFLPHTNVYELPNWIIKNFFKAIIVAFSIVVDSSDVDAGINSGAVLIMRRN